MAVNRGGEITKSSEGGLSVTSPYAPVLTVVLRVRRPQPMRRRC